MLCRGRPIAIRIALLAALMLIGGCATSSVWPQPNWHHDYDSARQRARRDQASMLVYYSESRPGRGDPLQDVLRDSQVSGACSRYVRCRLYVSHEPDRRFVGQYGVTRAPAWIVIHADGSYHSRVGAAVPAEIVAFLENANPPGETPGHYAYLPSPAAIVWHTSWPAAKAASEQEQRPILAVYTRILSRDWAKLGPLIDSLEVRRAREPFVHCRMDVADPWSQHADTPFGRIRLPALVVQRWDGTHEVLEQPNSPKAMVELLRRGTSPAENPENQDSVQAGVMESTAPPIPAGGLE